MDGSVDAAAPDPAAVAEARRNWAPAITPKAPVSASVDQLKGDLAIAKKQAQDATRDFRQAEGERKSLVEQVVGLEAQTRRFQQEAEQWRQRCLGFEQECAALAVREDTLQAKLREAHTRERTLAVRGIEGRILCTEAENVQAKAQAEARAQTWQAVQMESKLTSKSADVENLRDAVRDSHARGEAYRVEAESLRVQLRDGLGERDSNKDGLMEAERRYSVVEARITSLESALQTAAARQMDSAKEVAKHQKAAHDLEETNRRLRLDLQEAICQAVRAGEVPFYSGGGGRFQAVPACVEDAKGAADAAALVPWTTLESKLPRSLADGSSPQSSPRGPLSPRSRLDYPKSSHARQLRQKVLSTREEAMDYMEQLSREKT